MSAASEEIIDRVVAEVSELYLVEEEDLLSGGNDNRICVARRVIIYLLIHDYRFRPAEVGNVLGGKDSKTIRKVYTRTREHIIIHQGLREVVLLLRQRLSI